MTPEQLEIRELKKRNERFELEKEILKKATEAALIKSVTILVSTKPTHCQQGKAKQPKCGWFWDRRCNFKVVKVTVTLSI